MMKPYSFAALLVALLLAWSVLTGCTKEKAADPVPTTGSFALELDPVVGSAPLVLNAQTYAKSDGQTFTVSKFEFLLSNVKLTRADGSSYAVPDGYYLINANDDKTFRFVINKVPLGDYTSLSILVGVDPAHNNGTFQSGMLNHSNDLYREWSSEYVFLKMAGTSPQAGPGRALTFDIGGTSAARTVTPAFGTNVLPVREGHVPEVHIYVNVQALFESATPAKRINFTSTYSVESGSPWAPVMADNLTAGMFTTGHVHPN